MKESKNNYIYNNIFNINILEGDKYDIIIITVNNNLNYCLNEEN